MKAGSKSPTLFRSTAITVAGALVLLQLVIFAASLIYIFLPMVKRSTDDLAALMVLSAQTWVELPAQTRPAFELELARQHNLWLLDTPTPLPDYEHHIPYLQLLEEALEARTGKVTRTKVTDFGRIWYWVEFESGSQHISLGFPQDRLGMQSPLALLLIALATILLSVLAAVMIARRITKPLHELAEAARHVGMGNTPAALEAHGVRELDELSATFNRMAQQVQALLENRTVLLAGISHDLRTPLARMRLALEMLTPETSEKITRRLQLDIDEMNRLIGEFLAFSRGLEKESPQLTDLAKLLNELVDDARAIGGNIVWQAGEPCLHAIGQMALRRIVANLLSNAVRYGEGKPVELQCACDAQQAVIRVLDRGPGIPEEERENVLRPFYRIESSRSSVTGGSGLGLAIASQLAGANGWQLELRPREGGGLEARLTL